MLLVTSATLLACGASASAQEFQLLNSHIKDRANGILALRANSMVPDLASSNLSIKDAQTENPSVFMTQLGGGATMSKRFPIYLEGAIAYGRYDPTFVASAGADTRRIPTRWNTLTGTGALAGISRSPTNWSCAPSSISRWARWPPI